MPSRVSCFVLLTLLAWAAVATSALPHQGSRAIQQQQLSANDAAAVASHGVVKQPTVPACRVGDSACDPEDDVNGYCCPEGTITGSSSIENVMTNGKSVQKTVLKCIGTKRCADDSGEDAPKEAPSDETPSSEIDIEPCLAGDKACDDSATFPYATDNFGLAYGPKVDACCPQNTNRVQRLHNTAVRLTCQGAASSKCAGPKDALKKALKKKVDAKAAKKKKKAAEAAAEQAKAAAKALKEKADAAARKAAESKAAADAASKIAGAEVAAAKSAAANQPTSAHAGYAGTSVIFSSPGCTGKVIKTTSFTVGQCIRDERGGSTKANRCSVGGTWEFTSFSDSECKQVATQVTATGADKACTSGQTGTSTRITCKPKPGFFKKIWMKLGLMKG